VKGFGCERFPDIKMKRRCREFVELTTAQSLEDYLSEINLFYEFREKVEQINEIWVEYLLKP